MSDINIGLLPENQKLSEFKISENFSCVRFLDQNKERFELEFNLEKGTSFNTFFIRSRNNSGVKSTSSTLWTAWCIRLEEGK